MRTTLFKGQLPSFQSSYPDNPVCPQIEEMALNVLKEDDFKQKIGPEQQQTNF